MKIFKTTELDKINQVIKNTVEKNAEEIFGEYCWTAYKILVQFSVEPIINNERKEFGNEYMAKALSLT